MSCVSGDDNIMTEEQGEIAKLEVMTFSGAAPVTWPEFFETFKVYENSRGQRLFSRKKRAKTFFEEN